MTQVRAWKCWVSRTQPNLRRYAIALNLFVCTKRALQINLYFGTEVELKAVFQPMKCISRHVSEFLFFSILMLPLNADADLVKSQLNFQDEWNQIVETKECYFCRISGLDVSGVDLDSSSLENLIISSSRILDTDFSGSNLLNIRIGISDLSDSDLSY